MVNSVLRDQKRQKCINNFPLETNKNKTRKMIMGQDTDRGHSARCVNTVCANSKQYHF